MDQQYGEIQRSLGRIEGKLDAQAAQLIEVAAASGDNRGRIEQLEQWKMKVIGAASAIAAVIGAVSALVTEYLIP